MNIQTLSKILNTEDAYGAVQEFTWNVACQGLSTEEACFILSHDRNTLPRQLLSAVAYIYLHLNQDAIKLLDELVLQNQPSGLVWRAALHAVDQHYEQAILLLDKGIEQGDTCAMFSRAHLYKKGWGTKDNLPDYPQAILLLDKAIELGEPQAIIARADMYRKGRGTLNSEPDVIKAIQLLEKFISYDPQAMVIRAEMHINGEGTLNNQPNYELAILLLDKAIGLGDTSAMVWRAAMYRKGYGTVDNQPDYNNAIRLLEKAKAQGDITALPALEYIHKESSRKPIELLKEPLQPPINKVLSIRSSFQSIAQHVNSFFFNNESDKLRQVSIVARQEAP